jgi:type VI secretion system protein ImpC
MPRTSYADVQLDVETGRSEGDRLEPKREPAASKPGRDTPFRILVMGDFSGRSSRKIATKGPRKATAIDRDNFERVFESMQVQLRIPLQDAPPLEIALQEFDDFHPDRLYQKLPLFGKLRQLREDLGDAGRFQEIARDLGIAATVPAAPKPAPDPVPPPPLAAAAMGGILGGSLLDQAMEATEMRSPGAAPARPSSDPLAQYVKALVTPHLTPKPDPKRGEVMRQVDGAIAGVMRGLLHHPSFQQLEANWRALYFLVRELETSPMLKVFLLDISREEIDADLAAAEDLRSTALYKLLVEQTVRTPGAHPWAVIIGALTLGPSIEDLNLLGRIGLLARQAGAPFIAGGSPKLAGCDSFAATPYPEDWTPGPEREGWDLIRSLPEARYIGLVTPRFMIRRPYGSKSESTETFEFEELETKPGAKPNHEHFLWANSAFLCACLLGQSFAENGWGFDPNEFLNIRGLPHYIYSDNGEPAMTPPGEVTLTQTAMDKLMDDGLMVLMSYASGDQVRLAGFRSVAKPAAALCGRWG